MAPRLLCSQFNQSLTINNVAAFTRAWHKNPQIRVIQRRPGVRFDSVLFNKEFLCFVSGAVVSATCALPYWQSKNLNFSSRVELKFGENLHHNKIEKIDLYVAEVPENQKRSMVTLTGFRHWNLSSLSSILVVTTVLQREQHSLDEALVTVALSRNATVGIPDEEKMEESRTIEVTGLASTTTKDAIINFFENTRRSGGGEISDVEIVTEKGCAVLTFILAESEWEW